MGAAQHAVVVMPPAAVVPGSGSASVAVRASGAGRGASDGGAAAGRTPVPGAAPRGGGRSPGVHSWTGGRVRGPAVDGGRGAAELRPGRRRPEPRPCRALGRVPAG